MLVFVSLPQLSVSGSLPSATMLFTAPLNTVTGKLAIAQAIAGTALMLTLVLAVVVV